MAEREQGRRFTDGGDIETVIGKGTQIEGQITGKTSVEVRGAVKGTARIEGLCWVREGGRFDGDVFAQSVVVEGEVDGKITAEEKVELRASCRSRGSITTGSLAIADGSFYEGEIQMRSKDKSGGAPVNTFEEKRQSS